MCIVSNIGDNFGDEWARNPKINPFHPAIYPDREVTREEFNGLKAQMEALKKLLEAAKIYDQETGQPDCHMDEKVALIKRLAELVGVNMNEVFKND